MEAGPGSVDFRGSLRHRLVRPRALPLWLWAGGLTVGLALGLWWVSFRSSQSMSAFDTSREAEVLYATLAPRQARGALSHEEKLQFLRAAWTLGHIQEVVEVLEDLRRAPSPLPPWVYLLAAQALQQQGRPDEAVAWLQTGFAQYPEDEHLVRALAYSSFEQKDWDGSRRAFEILLQRNPRDEEILWRLALLWSSQDPVQGWAFVRRLSVHPLAPERKARVRVLESALARGLAQEHRGYRFVEAGRGLARLGYWNLALHAWRRAIEADPSYGPAWAYLGEALAREGRGEEAWMAWRRARQLDPEDPLPPFLMGLQALREGDAATAVGWLRRAVILAPEEPIYRYHLARALAELEGFFPQAWDQIQVVALQRSQNLTGLKLAARFSLVHQVYVENHALPWLRRVLEAYPEDVEALLLMGWAYMQLDEPDLAFRFLDRALRLAPGDPNVHRWLAVWYRWQGEMALAQEHEAWARRLQSVQDER